MILFLLFTLFLAATVPAWASPAKAPQKSYGPLEISRKKLDIESLNLLRALTLSHTQMKELLVLLYEADLEEREVLLGYKKDGLHAWKMLEMLEGKINRGESIDVPTEEDVWFALGTLYEYEFDQYRTAQVLTRKAVGLLSENQLQIIGEYMPCVVPWSTVKSPERIGQSGSIEKLEKMLDRLRKLKKEEYAREKRMFLVELDWRMRIDRHEDDRVRQVLVREIDQKIDEICRLGEEEYQIRKTELAQGVRPPDLEILPPRVGEDLDRFVELYVLNPHNIKYLQAQLKKEGVSFPLPDDVIDQDIDKKVD
jgi:hypothetical protein